MYVCAWVGGGEQDDYLLFPHGITFVQVLFPFLQFPLFFLRGREREKVTKECN